MKSIRISSDYRAKRDNASCFDETFLKSFAEELYNAIIEIIKENKTIIKNEVRDELRNELATKEDILLVEERLGKKIELLNQKIEREIKLVRRDMIIINLVIILAMYAPEIIGKLLIFR